VGVSSVLAIAKSKHFKMVSSSIYAVSFLGLALKATAQYVLLPLLTTSIQSSNGKISKSHPQIFPQSLLSHKLQYSKANLNFPPFRCVTAGYVPCLVPGASAPVAPEAITPYSGSSPYSGFGSGFFNSVSGAASDPIQFGGDRRRDLDTRSPLEDAYTEVAGIEKRQNSLCCRPKPVECLYADDVPFCYVRPPSLTPSLLNLENWD
jgi:hypothetical protein